MYDQKILLFAFCLSLSKVNVVLSSGSFLFQDSKYFETETVVAFKDASTCPQSPYSCVG